MRDRFMSSIFTLVAVLAFAADAPAQTAQRPAALGLKAIPRTPDGKPDLSGVWLRESPTDTRKRLGLPNRAEGGDPERGANLPFQPTARKMFEYHRDPLQPGRSRNELNPRATQCFPPDLQYLMLNDNDLIEILQNPARVLMIFEYDFWVRQVWIDDQHPEDPEVKWMGHSTGKWDGDTLVVDTVAIDDRNSYGGFLHSDALHLIERIRRVDHNLLENVITVDDPKTYTKPWTMEPAYYNLKPNARIEERVWCNERYNQGIWYGE